MLFRNAVVAVMVLSLLACTTVQTVHVTATADTVAGQVQPEDRVIITAKNGQTYDLRVQEVAADSLTGKTEAGKRYRVMYSAIKTIRIERTEGKGGAAGATVLLVLVGVGLVVLFVKGLEKFGEAMGCMFGCPPEDN